jgi:hypothetical protein
MKKLLLILLCLPMIGFGQTIDNSDFTRKQKLWNPNRKEAAKYQSIYHLINKLGKEENRIVTPIKIEALSSDNSGEITTLFYNCNEKEEAGLIIGFFNAELVINSTFQESSNFLILNSEQTNELLQAIDNIGDKWDKNNDYGDNSIYFSIDELTIFMDREKVTMRLFWKNFDSDWSFSSFNRTKKRYEKYLKKKAKGKI